MSLTAILDNINVVCNLGQYLYKNGYAFTRAVFAKTLEENFTRQKFTNYLATNLLTCRNFKDVSYFCKTGSFL